MNRFSKIKLNSHTAPNLKNSTRKFASQILLLCNYFHFVPSYLEKIYLPQDSFLSLENITIT